MNKLIFYFIKGNKFDIFEYIQFQYIHVILII